MHCIGFYWRMTLRVLLPSCDVSNRFCLKSARRRPRERDRGRSCHSWALCWDPGQKKTMIKVLHAIPPLYIFGILFHFYSNQKHKLRNYQRTTYSLVSAHKRLARMPTLTMYVTKSRNHSTSSTERRIFCPPVP